MVTWRAVGVQLSSSSSLLSYWRGAAPAAVLRSSIGYLPLYSNTKIVSEYEYISHDNPALCGFILILIFRDEKYFYSEMVENSVSVSH